MLYADTYGFTLTLVVRGATLRLESERDATVLQFAAGGTLYFWEGKDDRVTPTTICGGFPPSAVGEVVRFCNRPVRFTLSDAAIESARELVSAPAEDSSDGGAEDAADSGEEADVPAPANSTTAQNAAREERRRQRDARHEAQQVQPNGQPQQAAAPDSDSASNEQLQQLQHSKEAKQRAKRRVVQSDSD